MNASLCTLVASLLLAQAPTSAPYPSMPAPMGGCCGQQAHAATHWQGGSSMTPYRPHRPVRNLFWKVMDGFVTVFDPSVPVPGYGCCQYGSSGVWEVQQPVVGAPMVPVPLQPGTMPAQPVISISEPPLAAPGMQPVSAPAPAPRVIERASFGLPNAQ